VSLDVQLDEAIPHVKCDTSQMQQVIVNLVMNAAEATLGQGSGHVAGPPKSR
jgi:signal transduction histidine kinase